MIVRDDLHATAPAIDEDSAWWWESLRLDAPRFPRCRGCGRTFFPPMNSCPHCGGNDLERVRVSGLGHLHSWVVSHNAAESTFKGDVPYAVVAVELEEGPRVLGRWLGDLGGLRDCAPATLTPYRVGDIVLPGFSPGAGERADRGG